MALPRASLRGIAEPLHEGGLLRQRSLSGVTLPMTGWAVLLALPATLETGQRALVVFIRAKIFTRFTRDKTRQKSHYRSQQIHPNQEGTREKSQN